MYHIMVETRIFKILALKSDFHIFGDLDICLKIEYPHILNIRLTSLDSILSLITGVIGILFE